MHGISRQQLYPNKFQNWPFYTVQINFPVLPSHIQNHLLHYFAHCLLLKNKKINKTLLFRAHLVPGIRQNMVKTQSDGLNRQSYSHFLSFIVVSSPSSSTSSPSLSSSYLTWMLKTALPIKPNGLCVDHIFSLTGTDPVPETQHFSSLNLIFSTSDIQKKSVWYMIQDSVFSWG